MYDLTRDPLETFKPANANSAGKVIDAVRNILNSKTPFCE
jgi:hypothetical protein